MKNVILKFIGLGYDNVNQADVKIYDNNNCLVDCGKTYNNRFKTCLKKNNIYLLRAYSLGDVIYTYFYVNNNDIYCFRFNRSIYNGRNITFLLTDLNYIGLRIERGFLNLWQNQ